MQQALLRRLVTTGVTVLAATVSLSTCATLPVTVLHEFSFPSWFENLAIRASGQILTTRLDTPVLYQVDEVTGAPTVVATWDASEYAGALGIAEGAEDVFYVILAAFTDADFVKTSGVNSVFKVNMTTFALAGDGVSVETNATVTKVTDIPEADFLNGMATLDASHIYVGDVYSGVVYLVDVAAGTYVAAVDDPLMKFTYAADPTTNLGANGLKVRGGHLYWTNTAAGLVARIRVGADGLPEGSSSVVATNAAKADDFTFRDGDGALFVAQNQQDTLSAAYPGPLDNLSVAARPIAGSNASTVLAGVTSPKFGRTAGDSTRLYLSTSGGELSPGRSPWCSWPVLAVLAVLTMFDSPWTAHQRNCHRPWHHLIRRHRLLASRSSGHWRRRTT